MLFELERSKMIVPEKAKDFAEGIADLVNLIAWAVEEFTDDDGNIITDAVTVGSKLIEKFDEVEGMVEFFEELKTGDIAVSLVDIAYAIFASEAKRAIATTPDM